MSNTLCFDCHPFNLLTLAYRYLLNLPQELRQLKGCLTIIMFAKLLLVAGLSLRGSAETIPVAVGRSGLNFSPSTIQAAQGDVLEFRFWAKNHSVVAGSWTNACTPATSGGFYSGFFPTAEGGPNVSSSILLESPLQEVCNCPDREVLV